MMAVARSKLLSPVSAARPRRPWEAADCLGGCVAPKEDRVALVTQGGLPKIKTVPLRAADANSFLVEKPKISALWIVTRGSVRALRQVVQYSGLSSGIELNAYVLLRIKNHAGLQEMA